jgi:hypothetical protein
MKTTNLLSYFKAAALSLLFCASSCTQRNSEKLTLRNYTIHGDTLRITTLNDVTSQSDSSTYKIIVGNNKEKFEDPMYPLSRISAPDTNFNSLNLEDHYQGVISKKRIDALDKKSLKTLYKNLNDVVHAEQMKGDGRDLFSWEKGQLKNKIRKNIYLQNLD